MSEQTSEGVEMTRRPATSKDDLPEILVRSSEHERQNTAGRNVRITVWRILMALMREGKSHTVEVGSNVGL